MQIQKDPKTNKYRTAEILLERSDIKKRPKKFLDYFGTVNYTTNEKILEKIRLHSEKFGEEAIYLTVTSPGGTTGTATSFYDHIKYALKPNLVTIGSGDIDSSGIIIFLAGKKRYVTEHTTALLHLAGRTFKEGVRFTAGELEAMAKEDRIKDKQYASIVADNSGGKLSTDEVLQMMEKNTTLTPFELVNYGIADAIL